MRRGGDRIPELSQFEAWLKRNRSPRTIQAYLQTMHRFFGWLNGREATGELVDQFITHLIESGNSNSSAARHFSAVKAWFRWQRRSYELEDIVKPRPERHTPKFLTADQVKELVDQTLSPMYRAAFALQYATGLRFDELRSLGMEDINWDTDEITVIRAKQGGDQTQRTLPVHPDILEIVATYLTQAESGLWLFKHARGGRLDNYQYNCTLKAVCRAAGLPEITSHGLRHSWGTHLALNGVGRIWIQESMGHDDPKSTQIYTHLTAQQLKERLPHPFE